MLPRLLSAAQADPSVDDGSDAEGDPFEDAAYMYDAANELLDRPGPTTEAEFLLDACVKTLFSTVPQASAARKPRAASAIELKLSAPARALLSRAQVLLGRLCEWRAPLRALKCFESAVRADADHAEALLQLARALWRRACTQQELNEVERLLRAAIARARVEAESLDCGECGDCSDCDDEEDDSDDDDDDEEEETTEDTLKEASRLLARLLCQSPGRCDESRALLHSLGYRYALAHSISSGRFSPHGGHVSLSDRAPFAEHQQPVYCFDSVLSPCMLAHMKAAFAPAAPFWHEHAYDSPQTGFFSFQHAIQSEAALAQPSVPLSNSGGGGGLHDALLHIWRTAAAAHAPLRRARFAEWWAHSRPHCNGHTLHFDYVVQPEMPAASAASAAASATSTGRTRKRKDQSSPRPRMVPVHPIMSTVTFLTADCGGPTLVTDQTMSNEVTSSGWLVAPQLNRTIAFGGSQLHCVLPGAGPAPSADARRLTFMVAFWENDPRAPWFPLLDEAKAEAAASAAATASSTHGAASSVHESNSSSSAQTLKLSSSSSSFPSAAVSAAPLWPSTLAAPLPCACAAGASSASSKRAASVCSQQPLHALGVRNDRAIHVVDSVLEQVGARNIAAASTRSKKESAARASASGKRSKAAPSTSASADMLDPSVFCFFGALSANLAAAQQGTCSLNCGGQCEACVAALRADSADAEAVPLESKRASTSHAHAGKKIAK